MCVSGNNFMLCREAIPSVVLCMLGNQHVKDDVMSPREKRAFDISLHLLSSSPNESASGLWPFDFQHGNRRISKSILKTKGGHFITKVG